MHKEPATNLHHCASGQWSFSGFHRPMCGNALKALARLVKAGSECFPHEILRHWCNPASAAFDVLKFSFYWFFSKEVHRYFARLFVDNREFSRDFLEWWHHKRYFIWNFFHSHMKVFREYNLNVKRYVQFSIFWNIKSFASEFENDNFCVVQVWLAW